MPPAPPAKTAVALVAVVALVGSMVGAARAQKPGPAVAAAASLRYVMPEIVEHFSRRDGRAVRVSYGSSGNFFRQLRQGAPFELFLSADEGYVLGLVERGLIEDSGARYARGRLALFLPEHSSLNADEGLEGLASGVRSGRVRRLAIANPEHAPYGRAAREALRRLGVWETLANRILLGENVAQAMQFSLSGASDGGIVAASLVTAPRIAARGRTVPIPETWHAPLHQRMALMRGAGAVARELYAYILGAEARAAFERHGFGAPE